MGDEGQSQIGFPVGSQSAVGSFEFRRPIELDFKEYQKYDMEKALRNYWYERSQTSGQDASTRTIPQMKFGGQIFEQVFGLISSLRVLQNSVSACLTIKITILR